MAFVVVGFLVSGCSEPKADEGTAPEPVLRETGTLKGVVVTEAIVPLANVTVTTAPTPRQAMTSESGEFQFDDLPLGAIQVTAVLAGYVTQTITAEVNATGAAPVRIVLAANLTELAYQQQYKFDAFIEYSVGENSRIADLYIQQTGAPVPLSCPECYVTVPLDPNWKTIVFDAVWEDSVERPLGPTTYTWAVDIGEEFDVGESTSPMNVHVSTERFTPGGTEALLQVYPYTDWVYTNQQFFVVMTIWYREPAPEGWTALEPSA